MCSLCLVYQERACARTLFLAVPPDSLLDVSYTPPELRHTLHGDLDDLQPYSSGRLVFVYAQGSALYDKLSALPYIKTDLPIQEVHSRTWCGHLHQIDDTTNTGMEEVTEAAPPETVTGDIQCHIIVEMTFYGKDFSYVDSLLGGESYETDLWNASSSGPNASVLPSVRLVEKVHGYLNAASGTQDDGWLPRGAIFFRWTGDGVGGDDHGGGRYYWKAGADWDQVSRKLLRPFYDVSLYVVGSAYASSYRQLWAEGALETVDRALDIMFNEA